MRIFLSTIVTIASNNFQLSKRANESNYIKVVFDKIIMDPEFNIEPEEEKELGLTLIASGDPYFGKYIFDNGFDMLVMNIIRRLHGAKSILTSDGWNCHLILNLENLGLTFLPNINNVGMEFRCGMNNLTSLKGAPKSVKWGFKCRGNHLENLEYCPQRVNSDFDCSLNKLTSLIGGPEFVAGDFDCSYNKLTSLEGAPKEVIGSFYCYANSNRFNEKYIRSISDITGEISYDQDTVNEPNVIGASMDFQLSHRDITKYAQSDVVRRTADSLFKIIQFLFYRVPNRDKQKYLARLKGKVMRLNPGELGIKKLPPTAAIGQAIGITKNLLFGMNPSFVQQVITELTRLLATTPAYTPPLSPGVERV